jgi:hypothetical protein
LLWNEKLDEGRKKNITPLAPSHPCSGDRACDVKASERTSKSKFKTLWKTVSKTRKLLERINARKSMAVFSTVVLHNTHKIRTQSALDCPLLVKVEFG